MKTTLEQKFDLFFGSHVASRVRRLGLALARTTERWLLLPKSRIFSTLQEF